MSLAPGTRLGPYEVLGVLGTGGMGEVYKARDMRLDRTVAIKVLPPEVSGDPERRARFEREAKTVAGLNHAHICTLFDVGDHPSTGSGQATLYLVMEYLQGQTLAERLEKGPLPLEQALSIATDITDALSAAHRQGVIHRDLKPANAMLTKGGAKLLDFGLAKLTGHGEQPAAVRMVSAVPTREATLTGQGVILGTLQYMAPEQLEGKPPDARTDLWALGAIVYEMVTGKRAFEGTSPVSLMSAIIEREPPPLAALRPLTPPALDRLVKRCLAKSPDDRPDTAHDVASDLRWMRETSGVGAAGWTNPGRAPAWRSARAVAVVVMTVMVTATIMLLLLRAAAPRSSVAYLSLDVGPAEELNARGNSGGPWLPTPGGSRTAFVWTPDGRALVFVGRRDGTQQLYRRALDRDVARPLPGTEGAQVPAVSPDGEWVAFWAGEKLKKIPLSPAGGPVVEVASGVSRPLGLTWDARGNLYFGRVEDRRIWKVSAEGGQTAVTRGDATWAEILPCALPGGQALLYTVRQREWSWGDEEIVALTLATGERKVVLHDAVDARYVATGHLVFLRKGVLFAVAFDPERLEVRGPPVAMREDVAQALTGGDSTDVTGAGQFAIAPTGSLAWVRGPLVPYPSTALVSVDRHGRVSPLSADKKGYFTAVRLAPGGRQLAVAIRDLSEVSLWIYDLARGTLNALSRDGEAYLQAWTPDGQRLVFSWLKDGRPSLAWQRADGTTRPEVLIPGADVAPTSWTPDGRDLVVVTYDEHLAFVTMENGRASMQPPKRTPYKERWPSFSPDGHWLAYGSNDSGRTEVYVQPYPGPGPRVRVSIAGGESPAWHPNGHELFFVSLPDGVAKRRMMVARFDPGSAASVGTAQSLFELAGRELAFLGSPYLSYGVAPDGQRFYVIQQPMSPAPPVVTHINVIENWLEELNAKVPPAR